jgi:hypothetical protein
MDCFIATRPSPDAAAVCVALLIMFGILICLAIVAIKALICCRIFAKTGYCWALGLLMLVPIANIIMGLVQKWLIGGNSGERVSTMAER